MTEEALAIIILMLSAWAIVIWAATSFEGHEATRILRVELGSDSAQLNHAVAGPHNDGIAKDIPMVVRNTCMDYVFILLCWLTFVNLAMLAGCMGERVLGACAALLITVAAVKDVLENGAILTAMRVNPFTGSVPVDISEYSQWRWVFLFVASVLLRLAIALNHLVSHVPRLSRGLFIASGVCGLLGIMLYRVSLEYSLGMIDILRRLVGAALMLTSWKIYHSLKGVDRVEHGEHVHTHA